MLQACVIVLLNAILAIDAGIVLFSADGSACTIYISRKEPRYVPYTETYKVKKWGGLFHQTQSRVNVRIEYTTSWVTEIVCCAGYLEKNGKCEPICSVACVHGYCAKPDSCECDPGYKPVAALKNTCTPVCESNCENGYCDGPNRCGCNTGYLPSDDRSNCLPVCTQNCEENNARCVAPEICKCNPGYQLDNSTEMLNICTPICELPCVNGKCTAPNNCTCHDGYEISVENMFNCEPKCERPCIFGRCTMPNTCTCDSGYRLTENGFCEPICSKTCVNGACIAPETCRCDDGYGLLGSSVYDCMPICQQGACLNGVCSKPGVCTCNKGYLPTWTGDGEQTCLPFCKISCLPFGKCVAPDTCRCFEGYRALDTKQTEMEVSNSSNSVRVMSACQQVCEPPCGPNSYCSEPNVCACNLGYGRTENDVGNTCEPICDVRCGPNATCTAPNVCTCNEGYERDKDDGCKPSCTACHNGTCVATNVCQCMEGYVLTNESVCVQFCGNDCGNEDCATANECQRHFGGFETNETNSANVESCTRVCKGHGVCTENEKACECSYGWKGWDCDQPTVCILSVDPNDKSLRELVVYNETNSTLTDARHYAPYCYQCNETVGNKSFCFAMNTDDGTPTVGCFVETESPCYSMYHGNTATVSTMTGTLAVITILIMAVATTAAYFAIRRHRRNKMRAVIAQSALFQGSIANETLLSEEDT